MSNAAKARARGLVLLALVTGVGSHTAGAADASELRGGSGGGWLKQQLVRFRSYPHLDRAFRLIDSGRLVDAQTELEAALAADPGSTEARLAYLGVLMRNARFEAAIRQADQLIAAGVEPSRARMHRGFARMGMGDNEHALEDFKAVADDPATTAEDRRTATASQAELALKLGKHELALQALRANPQAGRSFDGAYRMGFLLESLGRMDEASSAYRDAATAARTAPQRAKAQLALGNAWRKRGDSSRARAAFEAARDAAPESPEAWRSLAQLASERSDHAQAEIAARKAFELAHAPGDAEQLAYALQAQRRYGPALDVFRELQQTRLAPAQRYRVLMASGQLLTRTGQPERAAERFREALRLRGDRDGWVALENALLAAGKDREAAELLRTHPGLHDAREQNLRLGRIYASLDDTQLATRYLEAANARGATPELEVQLGGLYARQGDSRKAAAYLERAVKSTGRAGLHRQLGGMYDNAGDWTHAIEHYQAALRTQPDSTVAMHLANLYRRVGDDAHADSYLVMVKDDTQAAPEMRRDAYRQLAYLRGSSGDTEQAITLFKHALAFDERDLATRKQLAYQLQRAHKYREALTEFSAVALASPAPEVLVEIASCHLSLGEKEQALNYLLIASADAERLPGDASRVALYGELGWLLAERNEIERAEHYLALAQQLEPTPARAVQLAGLQRRAGRLGEAESTISTVDASTFDAAQRVAYADEYAQLLVDQNRPAEAISWLETAESLAPASARQFKLGNLQYELGDYAEARRYFALAASGDKTKPEFLAALAQTERRTGHDALARQSLEKVLSLEPGNLAATRELAYVDLALGDRDAAINSFKRAIDLSLADTDGAIDPGTPAYKDVQAMRTEVTRLAMRWNATLYQSIRSNSGARGDAAPGNGGVIASQGGAELHYLSPLLASGAAQRGDFFARALWQTRPRTLAIKEDSLQASLGVRVKPIESQDLYLSAERLVKVGSQASSDWLFRATGTLGSGYAMRSGERDWNFTQFYGDLGYFARRGGTWAQFGEFRQGWTFNRNDELLITPHVTLSGRHQAPDPDRASYLEWGAGVSMRTLFNGSRYEAPRSSAEFLVQYKRGVSPSPRPGWVFTAVVTF